MSATLQLHPAFSFTFAQALKFHVYHYPDQVGYPTYPDTDYVTPTELADLELLGSSGDVTVFTAGTPVEILLLLRRAKVLIVEDRFVANTTPTAGVAAMSFYVTASETLQDGGSAAGNHATHQSSEADWADCRNGANLDSFGGTGMVVIGEDAGFNVYQAVLWFAITDEGPPEEGWGITT